jgi:hypothetical protein
MQRLAPVPRHLREGLSEADQARVEFWWGRLSAEDRRRFATRRDRRPNVRVVGRFTDEEGDLGRDEYPHEFPIDLYEYLVNHEISLSDTRVYHICTRHQAAACAVRAGEIPASFSCPLDRSVCPMRRVLALRPGRSLTLHVELVRDPCASPAP